MQPHVTMALMQDETPIPGLSKGFLVAVAACLAILVVGVFGQTVAHKYITLDDIQLIYFNPAAKGPTLANIKTAFTTFDPELYIPLTIVSYQMEYLVAGTNPAMTHAINVLLHLLNAVLVVWLAVLLSGKKWIGVLTGLLFAIHPLNVEAVAWASARKDVLSAAFYLSSFIAYLSWRRDSKRWLSILSIALFALGLLSKVMILTLPIALVLSDWLLNRKWNKTMVLDKLPYLGLSAIFGIVAIFGKQQIIESLTMKQTLLMAAKSTWFYIEKLVVPTKLAIMYPQSTPISLSSAEFFVPILLIAALVGLALYSMKYTRIGIFATAFFLLGVVPTFINFAKAGDIYFASDRYVYLPAIGLFLLAAWTLSFQIERKEHWREREKTRTVMNTLSGAAILMLLITTFHQTKLWRDSLSLFAHNTEMYPAAPAAHFNLGVLKLEHGDTKSAIASFKASLALRDRSNVHAGLASALKKQGDIEGAIREYGEARKVDADDAEPVFGLGNLYAEIGKNILAAESYEEALRIDPNYVAVYNNYGVLLMGEGKDDEAEKMFKTSYSINPSFSKTSYNLGKLYQTQLKVELSTEWLERALVLQPNDIDTLVDLVANAIVQKDPAKAVELLKAIAKLDPENVEAKALLREMVRLKMVR